jgi:hypothetical protein
MLAKGTNPESHVIPSCHVFLASFHLEQFLQSFLDFMTSVIFGLQYRPVILWNIAQYTVVLCFLTIIPILRSLGQNILEIMLLHPYRWHTMSLCSIIPVTGRSEKEGNRAEKKIYIGLVFREPSVQ